MTCPPAHQASPVDTVVSARSYAAHATVRVWHLSAGAWVVSGPAVTAPGSPPGIVRAPLTTVLLTAVPEERGAVRRTDECVTPYPRTRARARRALVDVHMRIAYDQVPDPRWAGHADVLCREQPPAAEGALRCVERTLATYRGCLVVATRDRGGGSLIGSRTGSAVMVLPTPGSLEVSGPDTAACASFLHSRLVRGRSWESLDNAVYRLCSGGAADTPRPTVRFRTVRKSTDTR